MDHKQQKFSRIEKRKGLFSSQNSPHFKLFVFSQMKIRSKFSIMRSNYDHNTKLKSNFFFIHNTKKTLFYNIG